MRKYLSFLLIFILAFSVNAQSIVKGISPSAVIHCYNHVVADNGVAMPILSSPGIGFEDTLIMGNDGTAGINPYGDPFAEEMCSLPMNNLSGKIVVVFRGTCTFNLKVQNAQAAGAVGLIIINQNDSLLVQMGGIDPTITIPVVMISHGDGLALKTAIQAGPTVVYMGHNGFSGTIITSSQNTCSTYPNGHATVNCSYGPDPHSYLWSIGDTSETIYQLGVGTYYVIAMDSINCTVRDSVVISSVNPISPSPTIVASSYVLDCSTSSVILTTSQPYPNYSWTGGTMYDTMIVTTCGTYAVAVSDSNFCPSVGSIYIACSYLSSPEICFVSTDSLSIGNNVIWEKPTTGGIDSFYVYRSSTDSLYSYIKIGELSFADTAIWYDNQINPNTQAYFYKITSIDTCGGETLLSDYHKTIHLNAFQDSVLNWNLSWTPYIGTSVGAYEVYRGSSPSNMTLYATLSSTDTSYVDQNPPTSGVTLYQLRVTIPVVCDPLLKSSSYGTIYSNIPYSESLGLKENGNLQNRLTVYPNPTNDKIYIEIPENENSVTIEILNASGKLFQRIENVNSPISVDFETLSRGIYFVRSVGNHSSQIVRIMKY